MPTATIDEITQQLIEYVGSDPIRAKEVATVMRDRLKGVSQELINVGAKLGKKESGTKVVQLETQLATAKETLEATQTELAEFKQRVPDVRTVEENEKRKWEPRLKTERDRADKAESQAKDLHLQVFRDKLSTHLTRSDTNGVRLDDDPLILRALVAQYQDRFVLRDDGTQEILQIDNDTPYDGRTLDDKIGALADDARRRVGSKFLIAATDSGSGVGRQQGGGGLNGSLKSEAEILESKRQNPAFAGL